MSTARAFGQIMGENGVTLVYGGGGNGLMGAVANGVIEKGVCPTCDGLHVSLLVQSPFIC